MKRFFSIVLCLLLITLAACKLPAVEPEPTATDAPDEPQGQGDLVFNTTTLYGEPIGSDMIKDYDLVVVNFWADWCGWCVYEMPELERIHQEYPNVLLLGVLAFPNSMDDSLQILKDNNITFLTLEPAGTLVDLANGLDAFPTTYFFDRNGNSIGEPVVGAQDYDGWKATVEGLLP
ncbi:MAG: redoxin domain-containing protein [Clostridia bacterium]|nr:redoxin domain-containing protein [Clostridia bacterium]